MPPRPAVPSLMAMGFGQSGRLFCVSSDMFKALQELLEGAAGSHAPMQRSRLFYLLGTIFSYFIYTGDTLCASDTLALPLPRGPGTVLMYDPVTYMSANTPLATTSGLT
jgi:hypothetical protein